MHHCRFDSARHVATELTRPVLFGLIQQRAYETRVHDMDEL